MGNKASKSKPSSGATSADAGAGKKSKDKKSKGKGANGDPVVPSTAAATTAAGKAGGTTAAQPAGTEYRAQLGMANGRSTSEHPSGSGVGATAGGSRSTGNADGGASALASGAATGPETASAAEPRQPASRPVGAPLSPDQHPAAPAPAPMVARASAPAAPTAGPLASTASQPVLEPRSNNPGTASSAAPGGHHSMGGSPESVATAAHVPRGAASRARTGQRRPASSHQSTAPGARKTRGGPPSAVTSPKDTSRSIDESELSRQQRELNAREAQLKREAERLSIVASALQSDARKMHATIRATALAEAEARARVRREDSAAKRSAAEVERDARDVEAKRRKLAAEHALLKATVAARMGEGSVSLADVAMAEQAAAQRTWEPRRPNDAVADAAAAKTRARHGGASGTTRRKVGAVAPVPRTTFSGLPVDETGRVVYPARKTAPDASAARTAPPGGGEPQRPGARGPAQPPLAPMIVSIDLNELERLPLSPIEPAARTHAARDQTRAAPAFGYTEAQYRSARGRPAAAPAHAPLGAPHRGGAPAMGAVSSERHSSSSGSSSGSRPSQSSSLRVSALGGATKPSRGESLDQLFVVPEFEHQRRAGRHAPAAGAGGYAAQFAASKRANATGGGGASTVVSTAGAPSAAAGDAGGYLQLHQRKSQAASMAPSLDGARAGSTAKARQGSRAPVHVAMDDAHDAASGPLGYVPIYGTNDTRATSDASASRRRPAAPSSRGSQRKHGARARASDDDSDASLSTLSTLQRDRDARHADALAARVVVVNLAGSDADGSHEDAAGAANELRDTRAGELYDEHYDGDLDGDGMEPVDDDDELREILGRMEAFQREIAARKAGGSASVSPARGSAAPLSTAAPAAHSASSQPTQPVRQTAAPGAGAHARHALAMDDDESDVGHDDDQAPADGDEIVRASGSQTGGIDNDDDSSNAHPSAATQPRAENKDQAARLVDPPMPTRGPSSTKPPVTVAASAHVDADCFSSGSVDDADLAPAGGAPIHARSFDDSCESDDEFVPRPQPVPTPKTAGPRSALAAMDTSSPDGRNYTIASSPLALNLGSDDERSPSASPVLTRPASGAAAPVLAATRAPVVAVAVAPAPAPAPAPTSALARAPEPATATVPVFTVDLSSSGPFPPTSSAPAARPAPGALAGAGAGRRPVIADSSSDSSVNVSWEFKYSETARERTATKAP